MAQHARFSKAPEAPGVKVIASKFESKPAEEAVQRPIDPIVTTWPPVKVTADAVMLAAAAAQAPAKSPKRLDPVLSSSSRTPVKEAAHQVLAAGEMEKNRRVVGLAVMEAARYASGMELPVKVAAAHHEEVIAAHRVVQTPVSRRSGPPNSAPGRAGVSADVAVDAAASGSEPISATAREPPMSSPAAVGRPMDDRVCPAAQPDVEEWHVAGIAPNDGHAAGHPMDADSSVSEVEQPDIEEHTEGIVPGCERGDLSEEMTSAGSSLPYSEHGESFEEVTSGNTSLAGGSTAVKSVSDVLDNPEQQDVVGGANVDTPAVEVPLPSTTIARLKSASRTFFNGTIPKSTRHPLPNIVDIVSSALEAADTDLDDDELFGDGLDILDLSLRSRRQQVASAASAAKSVVEHDAFIIEEDDVRAAIERAEDARLRREDEEQSSREESMRRSQFRKGEVYLV